MTCLGCRFIQVPVECFNKVLVCECIRAQSYAERLRLGLAVMHGAAHNFQLVMSDGPRLSPPAGPAHARTGLELPRKQGKAAECPLAARAFIPTHERKRGPDRSSSVSAMMPKEKPPITVVGDVGGRIAIIVVSFRRLL